MFQNEEKMKALAIRLFEIDAFKFGDYKMKVGINSPVYFDLRVVVSYPDVMETVASLMYDFMEEKNLEYKHLCGVPYTALPFATILSIRGLKPMLIRRKEAKAYGTKKLIEGKFNAGEICLIIEDVVTSGSSVLETVQDLRSEGITVNDAIVVVDREQGGVENIKQNGVRMHSLFTLSYLLGVLKEANKIDEATVEAVKKYISACQIKSDGSFVDNNTKIINKLDRTKMSFKDRANLAKSPVSKRLFNIMTEKKSNLCVSADLTKSDEILNLAEQIGPYICVLKTHVDIIEDFSENFVNSLKSLAQKHNFLIMEDRKFADIGNTVALQYSKGIFGISNWADLVTVHTIAGQGIIQGLKSALPHTGDRGAILIGEMSSQGNLITPSYVESTMKIAANDPDFISGIVCQNKNIVVTPGIIQMTPGVRIDEVKDNLGQVYNTPESIIKENGADIGIVGRGIINAKNVEAAAELYRVQLWSAYIKRIEE